MKLDDATTRLFYANATLDGVEKMAMDDLEALKPLPHILSVLELLRTAPDNSTALAQESSILKTMFRKARERAEEIEGADLSVEDQNEVIAILQSKLEMKQKMIESVGLTESEDTVSKVKLEDSPRDIVMTG